MRGLKRVATSLVILGLAALGPGVAAASEPIDLPGPRAAPESLSSTADGTIYVGGFAVGGVLRIKPGGKPEPWIAPGAFGTRSILGVLADDAGHRVWVCSNDMTMRGIPGPGQVTGSYVKAFDLATGQPVASAKLPGDHTLCNDIAIGPDGAAYVTNSLAPEILRLKPGSDALEVWATDPRFTPSPDGQSALDGITFDAAGNLLVTVIYKGELYRVDVKDGRPAGITQLKPSQPLKRPDGLRPAGDGSYLLVEGGSGKLDRLTVSGDEAKIDMLKDGFEGPTSATRVGRTAWVSEGRLNELTHPTGKPLRPFRIYPVDLAGP